LTIVKNHTEQFSGVAQSDVSAALREAADRLERNVRAADAAGLVDDFYAEDAQVLALGRPAIVGRHHLVSYWQGMFDGGLRNVFIEIALVGAGGDLAYEISKYTLVVGSVGPSEIRTHIKYLVVHRRQEDGLWKTIAHICGM